MAPHSPECSAWPSWLTRHWPNATRTRPRPGALEVDLCDRILRVEMGDSMRQEAEVGNAARVSHETVGRITLTTVAPPHPSRATTALWVTPAAPNTTKSPVLLPAEALIGMFRLSSRSPAVWMHVAAGPDATWDLVRAPQRLRRPCGIGRGDGERTQGGDVVLERERVRRRGLEMRCALRSRWYAMCSTPGHDQNAEGGARAAPGGSGA